MLKYGYLVVKGTDQEQKPRVYSRFNITEKAKFAKVSFANKFLFLSVSINMFFKQIVEFESKMNINMVWYSLFFRALTSEAEVQFLNISHKN